MSHPEKLVEIQSKKLDELIKAFAAYAMTMRANGNDSSSNTSFENFLKELDRIRNL